MDDAIMYTNELRKQFGDVAALTGLDLMVPSNIVYGLLGPNGAGKSTTVRILSTLTRPTGGQAVVAGFDVALDPGEVRKVIGLAGQDASLDDKLTARENLRIFGRLSRLGSRGARRRADELLERFDLAHAGDRLVGSYSGGMRRRVHLIASLSRGALPRRAHHGARRPESPGNLGERPPAGGRWHHGPAHHPVPGGGGPARLGRRRDRPWPSDRRGSPAQLKSQIGSHIDVVVESTEHLPSAMALLERLIGQRPEADGLHIVVAAVDAVPTVPQIVRELDASGAVIRDVGIREPSLDDVFLSLTGKNVESAKPVEASEVVA